MEIIQAKSRPIFELRHLGTELIENITQSMVSHLYIRLCMMLQGNIHIYGVYHAVNKIKQEHTVNHMEPLMFNEPQQELTGFQSKFLV